MDGKIGNIVICHLLEGCDHFAVFINAHGIKMAVCALHNELTNGQGYHIRFSNRQLCDVQLAGSTLRDDSRIGGQILDVRPVDVCRTDICLDHAGNRSGQRGDRRPVDIGFIDIRACNLCLGDGGNVSCQRFDLRPLNVGIDDVRCRQLRSGDHCNGSVKLVRRDLPGSQFLNFRGNRSDCIGVQRFDQRLRNVCLRDGCCLDVCALDRCSLHLQTAD